MRAIFISYRREDAEGQAGRLFDDLVTHFGENSVFMDVVGIEPGRDFRRVIDQHVASCGVLLAVIGKNWFDAKDEAGRRRLEDPMDFVRLETASALKRDIPVIPVLVRGATMPRAEQLPPDLAELAYRNGVELTHARWDSDVEILIRALRPHVELLQKDVGSGKAEPATRVPTTARTAGTVPASGEPAVDSTAPVVTPQSTKKSLRVIVATSVTVIAVVVAGYLVYEKVAEKEVLRAALVAEAEKFAAEPPKKTENEKVAADQTKKTGTENVAAASPSTPALPESYTLAGTWEDDQGNVYATVPDPKSKGVFEMEQIKPRKEHDSLWKATLNGRDVEIDIFALPSGSHQGHMNLELSLDGNRMVGLSGPGGAGPDVPSEPIRFRRIIRGG
jgi:hypothetical protein